MDDQEAVVEDAGQRQGIETRHEGIEDIFVVLEEHFLLEVKEGGQLTALMISS